MKQLSKLKVKNISSVLQSIRDNSNISKKNLSVMLGLSSQIFVMNLKKNLLFLKEVPFLQIKLVDLKLLLISIII